MSTKSALVCGAGDLSVVTCKKAQVRWLLGTWGGFEISGFSTTAADDFVIADLRNASSWSEILNVDFDETYQLAADMGEQDISSQGLTTQM